MLLISFCPCLCASAQRFAFSPKRVSGNYSSLFFVPCKTWLPELVYDDWYRNYGIRKEPGFAFGVKKKDAQVAVDARATAY